MEEEKLKAYEALKELNERILVRCRLTDDDLILMQELINVINY